MFLVLTNMSIDNKEDVRATIADLVATGGSDKSDFFRSVPESNDGAASGSYGSDAVGIMDLLLNADMLIPGSKLGPEFSDDYRRIKRPLLSNAFGKTASLVDRGNLMLVTSSVPGEGKTHTAINLALSIAQERDHTVLLVDCDVTRKGVSHMLGVADRAGLVDVLENENLTIGDVMLRTDVTELSILSAGKQHEYVTELLASQRMASLVNEIASRYKDRVIIFDGPPLLPTPQTQVLAGLVEEALALIPEEKATGLVMNKSEGISERSGYYYGYYGSDQDKNKS